MIHLRQQIDQIDLQLKELLTRRARLVFEIQKFKTEFQIPLRDHQREKEILTNIVSNLNPRENRYLTEIYQAIFKASE